MAQDPAIQIDMSGVPDAGIRKTPIVTKKQEGEEQQELQSDRFSEALVQAEVPAEKTEDKTFAGQLYQIEVPQAKKFVLGTGNPKTDQYVGSVLGSINAIQTGRSTYDSISEKIASVESDPNLGVTLNSELNDLAEKNLQASVAAIAAALGKEGTDEETITAVIQQLQAWRQEFGPGEFEKITGDELSGLLALKSKEGNDIARRVVLQQYGHTLMAKRMDEITNPVDKVYDFVKLAFLPSTAFALGSVFEKFDPGFLKQTKNLGKEFLRTKFRGKGFDAYKYLLDEYWKRTPESQLTLFDSVESHIAEISSSNVFVYTMLMEPFLDRSAYKDARLSYDIDTFTVGLLAAGKIATYAARIKAITAARKPIQILNQTGQNERAAEIINRALADTDARNMRRVTGMEYEEVAASATPLDLTRVIPEQLEGAAVAAGQQLEKEILGRVGVVDQAFVHSFDPAVNPRRFYFDEAAKEAKIREVLGENNTYTSRAQIVERSDDGFTVEVTRSTNKYWLESLVGNPKYDLKTRQASQRVLELQRQELQAQVNSINDALVDLKRTNPSLRFEAQEGRLSNAQTKLKDVQAKMADNEAVLRELRKSSPNKQDWVDNLNAAQRQTYDAAQSQRASLESERAYWAEEVRMQDDFVKELKTPDNLGPPIDTAFDEARLAQLQQKLKEVDLKLSNNQKIIDELINPNSIEKSTIKYTFDQQGNFAVQEIGKGVSHKLNSYEQTVGQLHPTQVGDAMLAEFNEAKLIHNLSVAGRQVFRGLNKAQRENVDKILQHGDELGRRFDYTELVGGIDTRFGRVQLKSTTEVSSYYAARRYFDNLHRAENYLVRRGYEVGGFQELNTALKGADGSPIKAFAKKTQAKIPDDVKRIYDHAAGKIVDVKDIVNVDARIQRGDVILNLRRSIKSGDEFVTYAIAEEKALKPPSGKVLDYRPGYVPRVRPKVAYVVGRTRDAIVNGVKVPRQETIRFFENLPDAQKWVAQQADGSEMRILPDKQYRSSEGGDFTSEFDNLNFGGSLYTGSRSDRTILMGLDSGIVSDRMSSYKALQMYANHVAHRYSTNELKMNLIARFQKTFGEFLQNPANWRSELTVEAKNNIKLRDTINTQRNFIDDLIKVPDSFQQWWADRMRAISESMAKVEWLKGKPSNFVMRMGNKDPVAALRNATFHQYLGFFNPSQLLVQSFGAATAVAAYPLKAPKLIARNLALRAAWFERGNPGLLTKIAGYASMTGKELESIVKEIDQIGLFANLKSTADYAATEAGVSMSADVARRMLNAGLIFMREGEMTARGYGYLLARDLFLSSKPKGYQLTQADIVAIGRDSTRFTLNLTRSNSAWWQKGILSIPTQFWQISAKFTEAMVGGSWGLGVRRWTPAEKGKILLGYLAMFGVGGAPFMDAMVSDAMNAYKQSTDDPKAMGTDRINPFNNLPPELRVDDQTFARMIRGGLTQVMANWLTGGDPQIVNRVSPPAGVVESIEMYGKDGGGVVKLLGGAALPGQMRWLTAARGLYEIWAPGYWDGYKWTPRSGGDLTAEEYRQAAAEVAKIVSTFRNAEKALFWERLGYVADSQGKRLFVEMETEEFNSTLIWQGLGFSPASVGWLYDAVEGTQELKTRVEDVVDTAYNMSTRYAAGPDAVDTPQKRENLNIRINMLLMSQNFSESETQEFWKLLAQKELNNDAKITRIVEEALSREAQADGRVTKGMLANPILTAPKQETP